MTAREIGRFVDELASTIVPNGLYNQYRGPENTVRRNNLTCYLAEMALYKPTILLVGEAPGYRGCRLTGVPFVSQQLLSEGVACDEPGQWQLFGLEQGYERTTEQPQLNREASSTIVWETLSHYPKLPLIWNALPFHPHKPNTPWSNRTPKTAELQLGQPFLQTLPYLYPITQIAAVGNKAAWAVDKWGVTEGGLTAVKVRHPSHGGKRAFTEQIGRLLA